MTRAEESLARHLAARPAGEPSFATALREAGGERFRRLLLPTVRHEDWRYTSLSALAELPLAPAAPVRLDAAAVARLGGLPPAPRLVLVNGRIDPALTDLSGLPAGVHAGSLSAALRERAALVEPHLGAGPFGEQAFDGLSAALFADGPFVHLPDGAKLEAPIQILHLTAAGSGPVASFPRALFLAERGVRATVVESWAGEGAAYLAAGLAEVVVGEESELELVRVQREAPGAFHVGLLGVRQGAGSTFHGRSVALGARLARVEMRAVLGEGARNHLDGLTVASGEQLHDHFVLVDHAAPGGTSRELFKGILDGKARGVFSGRVLVRPGAQKTDAAQVSSNLLLSDDATVDARPQLEILADDVKCSHGGTVGQLDDDALFYLRSRGLDRPTARALLTWAFAAEVVERLPAAVRGPIRRLVTDRLPGGSALREAA